MEVGRIKFRPVDRAGRRTVRRKVKGERVKDLFSATSLGGARGGNYH